jgi:hypothetical protein
MIDDQSLIKRKQEKINHSSREATIDVQLFPEDQYVSDLYFKDSVATFIESYISENLKVSDFFGLHMFPVEFGFVNDFLSLLLHFKYQLLISE